MRRSTGRRRESDTESDSQCHRDDVRPTATADHICSPWCCVHHTDAQSHFQFGIGLNGLKRLKGSADLSGSAVGHFFPIGCRSASNAGHELPLFSRATRMTRDRVWGN